MTAEPDQRLSAALHRIATAAPTKDDTSRQWALDLTEGMIAVGQRRSRRRPMLALAAAAVVVLGGASALILARRSPDREPSIPAAADLVIRRVAPEQREGFVFDRAYQIADYPVVNIGRADPPDPRMAFCIWKGDGGSCNATELSWWSEMHNETSNAWVWTQVPPATAIVRFTNRLGTVIEQVPLDGIAILPDGTKGPIDNCDCEVAAFDANGNLLAAEKPT